MKATSKGKVVAKPVKPVKDSAISGGGFKVAAKTYRHGDSNVAAKTTKAETILANIADGLSPEAQEKREMSRVNLFRETINQDRKDRVADERVQEFKLEIQALKKENSVLRHKNQYYRDRATEAVTTLNVLANGNSFTPIHGHSTLYTPMMPAFTPDPSLYAVPATDYQFTEPEGIAGPGPQTMHYRQQAAEVDDLMIPEDM